MRRKLGWLLTTLLAATSVAWAQATVPADSRVRVSLRDGSQVTGKLSEVRGDTLIVISDGMLFHPTWRVSADETKSVEVSRGRERSGEHVLAAALLGAGLGALAALAVPGLADDGCSGDVCDGPSLAVPMLLGLSIGAALGGLSRVDRWETLSTPVRLGFGVAPEGARLGLSLAF
jgi:hypothetical protein